MIRTTITPDNTDIHLAVPASYIGRKLEVMLYPVDEIDEPVTKPAKRKPSEFAGTLSKEEGEKFQEYLKKTRDEWERIF